MRTDGLGGYILWSSLLQNHLSSHQSPYSERKSMSDIADCVVREYRAFVADYAKELKDEEVYQIAYIWLKGKTDITIYKPSNEKKEGPLELFSTLESMGLFCAAEPGGLVEFSKQINRFDLVKKVETFMKNREKVGKDSKKNNKKKRVITTTATPASDEHKRLNQARARMITQNMKRERYIQELETLMQKPDYEPELCVTLVRKSEDLAHDHVYDMRQVQNYFGVRSRASSSASSSSDSSTESNRRISQEAKVLPTLQEQPPAIEAEYEDVIVPAQLEEMGKASPNLLTRHPRQASASNPKPVPKVGSPFFRRRLAPTCEESKGSMSQIVVSRTPPPIPGGKFCLPPSPLLPLQNTSRREEAEVVEEQDKTGDSGMGTGSGSYDPLVDWRSAIINPPTEKPRRTLPKTPEGANVYASLDNRTMDPEHSYIFVAHGRPF